jgi:hypothetical protein
MGMSKFDRNAHHAGTHQETELYHAQTQPPTPELRLQAAHELILRAYGYADGQLPKMDRTYHKAGLLANRDA